MASMNITIDTSDCSTVVGAVAKTYDRLELPDRDRFAEELQKIIDDNNLVDFHAPKRGPTLEAFASAALLDLLRKYD